MNIYRGGFFRSALDTATVLSKVFAWREIRSLASIYSFNYERKEVGVEVYRERARNERWHWKICSISQRLEQHEAQIH